MRILWVSNYTTQSGYSNQARLWVKRIAALGHRIDVLNIGGGGGMPTMVEGIQVLPTALDMLGNDIIPAYVEKQRYDAVMSLTDTWAFRPEIMSQVRWFPLTPIDHAPVPPAVDASLKAARTPIAISKFGVEQLRAAGYHPMYFPHGVDPNVFKPVDMQSARRQIGVPTDAFWVSFVGVNADAPSRKGIPELLMAWSMFSRKHADAKLYLHTAEMGNLPVTSGGGVRIDLLLKTLGIDTNTIRLVDQFDYRTGIGQSYLALMYAASDVLILPTKGEGFGLPLIESQRCGCPVITTDFAAGSELCASGWLVDHEPTWSLQSAFNARPSVASIVERLEEAYAHRGDMRKRMDAVTFAREYDADTVFARYGKPVIDAIATDALESVKVA